MPHRRTACSCTYLHFMGTIIHHHLLRLCGHMFPIRSLMAHRCWIIMFSPISWMVWTSFRCLSQILDSYQMGCRILGNQMIWSGLDLCLSGPLTFHKIWPQLRWEFTHFRQHVLLLLRIYQLVHWWFHCMNCGIILHHTVPPSLITASSSFQHNMFLPCCPYHISQWYLPRGPLNQVLGVWLPWPPSHSIAVHIPIP